VNAHKKRIEPGERSPNGLSRSEDDGDALKQLTRSIVFTAFGRCNDRTGTSL